MNNPLLRARVLLDTNAFGFVIKKGDPKKFVHALETNPFLVCGCSVIRRELRGVSENSGIQLRSHLLEIYDALVATKRNYPVSTTAEKLAKNYFQEYRGSSSWRELKNDFSIVGVAVVHAIPAIVTNDENTMASKQAILANEKEKRFTPKFISADAFYLKLK